MKKATLRFLEFSFCCASLAFDIRKDFEEKAGA